MTFLPLDHPSTESPHQPNSTSPCLSHHTYPIPVLLPSPHNTTTTPFLSSYHLPQHSHLSQPYQPTRYTPFTFTPYAYTSHSPHQSWQLTPHHMTPTQPSPATLLPFTTLSPLYFYHPTLTHHTYPHPSPNIYLNLHPISLLWSTDISFGTQFVLHTWHYNCRNLYQWRISTDKLNNPLHNQDVPLLLQYFVPNKIPPSLLALRGVRS